MLVDITASCDRREIDQQIIRPIHCTRARTRSGRVRKQKMAISAHLLRRAPKKVGGASILQPLLGMSTDSPRSVRGHNRESRRIMRERADHIVTARGSPHDRSVHGLGQRGRLANNDEALRTKRGNTGRL